MKGRKILISLFLIAGVFIIPVFTQNTFSGEEKLTAEFIRLKKFRLSENSAKQGNTAMSDVGPDLTEEQKVFLRIFEPLFSVKGEIEIDTRSNTVIVTDTKNRIKLHKEFFAILDNSNLNLKELTSRKSDEVDNYSLEIPLQNLQLTTGCGTGEIKLSWRQEQAILLLSVIRKILSSNGTLEVDGRANILTVIDNRRRIILIKQIVELFDKPFLEEANNK